MWLKTKKLATRFNCKKKGQAQNLSFFRFFKGISKQDGMLFLQKKCFATRQGLFCVFLPPRGGQMGVFCQQMAGFCCRLLVARLGKSSKGVLNTKTRPRVRGKCTFEGLLAQNVTLVQQFAFALACGASGKTFCVDVWPSFANCNAMGCWQTVVCHGKPLVTWWKLLVAHLQKHNGLQIFCKSVDNLARIAPFGAGAQKCFWLRMFCKNLHSI